MMIELSSEVMPIGSYISCPPVPYSSSQQSIQDSSKTQHFHSIRHQSFLLPTLTNINVQTLQHRIHLPEMRPLRRHKMAR